MAANSTLLAVGKSLVSVVPKEALAQIAHIKQMERAGIRKMAALVPRRLPAPVVSNSWQTYYHIMHYEGDKSSDVH